MQFCVKLVACATLFLTHALQWLSDESERTWEAGSTGMNVNSRIEADELFTMAEVLVWVRSLLSSVLIWLTASRLGCQLT